jgi:hypothetical protein
MCDFLSPSRQMAGQYLKSQYGRLLHHHPVHYSLLYTACAIHSVRKEIVLEQVGLNK